MTEFIDGYKITDKKSIRALGISLQEIDRKLFEAFGEQIFKTGFVHADPHPGNGTTSQLYLTFFEIFHF